VVISQQKFRPPGRPDRVITRERLWTRIAFDPRRWAWLVVAQAGFGKTTLLSTVRTAAQARGDTVIWLSLDGQDDEPRFLAAVLQAIAQIADGSPLLAEAENVKQKLTEMGAKQNPIWILLDDLHLMPAETIRLVFNLFVDDPPPYCRFVASSRSLDGLPLAKARMAGLVDVLDAEDLRLSLAEIAELGQLAQGPQLHHIAALSGGWPIAAAALISDPRSLEGWSHHGKSALLSYIEEEVITTLTTDQLNVLTNCSLIEEVSLEDVEQLIETRDGKIALASGLRKLNGLILRWPERTKSYRLNPALAACLRNRLFVTSGMQAEAAIERAAMRLTSTHRVGEAATLAREARHGVLLRRLLLEQSAVELWLSGREEISLLLALADEELRLSDPQLLLMSMIVNMKEGRIGEAEISLALASQRWPQGHSPEQLDVLRVGLVVYGCKAFDNVEKARLARLLDSSSEDAKWRVIAESAACLLYLQQGAVETATTMAIAAMNSVNPERLSYGVLFLNYHLSAIAAAVGDTKRARDLLRNGRLIQRTRFARDEGAETVAAVQSAELDYELGRLATARARVRLIEARLHRMEGWFDVYASAFATSARMFEHDLGLPAALEHLRANALSLRRRQLGRVGDHLDVLATLIQACAALNGRGDDYVIQPPSIAGWEIAGWREREAISLARAAVLLLQADATGALSELGRLIGFARTSGIKRMELRAQLMSSEAAERLGNTELAQTAFEKALQIGLATGFRRSFLNFGGPGTSDRLHLIAAANSPAGRFAQSIVGAARIDRAGSDIRLTRREQDVLQAIEAGGSDKAIARRLSVSEHAIRFHLKNIFHKLKAHSRSEAVQAGRRLGVLDLLDSVGAAFVDERETLPN
jgi:LuxR family maltose regulon positive regulatory protein